MGERDVQAGPVGRGRHQRDHVCRRDRGRARGGLDFHGEASNYVVSLFAVGLTLRYRSMAAFAKGATMGVFGLWVLGVTTWHAWK